MHGDAPRSHLTGVPGWETPDEQRLLLALAQSVPEDGEIVEIGAEFGMSASLFARGARPGVAITSIDLFPGDLLERHRANLAEAGIDRTDQVKGDSAMVGLSWDAPIDLLFVDGSHVYRDVVADIQTWVHHVKVGGIVAFHDAAPATNKTPHLLHYEVDRAVEEWINFASDWTELSSVDSIRVFRRVR